MVLESQQVAKQPANPPACPPETSTELMGSSLPPSPRPAKGQTLAQTLQPPGSLYDPEAPSVGRWGRHCPHLLCRPCRGNSTWEGCHLFSLTLPVGPPCARHGRPKREGEGALLGRPPPGAPVSVDGCTSATPFLILLFAFPSCPHTGPNHLTASISCCHLHTQGPSILCLQVTTHLALLSTRPSPHTPSFAGWPEVRHPGDVSPYSIIGTPRSPSRQPLRQ